MSGFLIGRKSMITSFVTFRSFCRSVECNRERGEWVGGSVIHDISCILNSVQISDGAKHINSARLRRF